MDIRLSVYKSLLIDFLYDDVIGIIIGYINTKYKYERKICEINTIKSESIIGVNSNGVYLLVNGNLLLHTFSNKRKIILYGNYGLGAYLEHNHHFLLILKNYIKIIDSDELLIIKEIYYPRIYKIIHDENYIYLFSGNVIAKMSYNYEIIELINVGDELNRNGVLIVRNNTIYQSNTNNCMTNIFDIFMGNIIRNNNNKIFEFIKSKMIWWLCIHYKGITNQNIFTFFNNKLEVFDHNYNEIRKYELKIDSCHGLIVFESYILILCNNKYHILERY